jgi:hypothetical protein
MHRTGSSLPSLRQFFISVYFWEALLLSSEKNMIGAEEQVEDKFYGSFRDKWLPSYGISAGAGDYCLNGS